MDFHRGNRSPVSGKRDSDMQSFVSSIAAFSFHVKKMQVPQKDKTGLLAGGASAP